MAIYGVTVNTGTYANMRLDVADAAVKGVCYEIADSEFRYVMQLYVGNAYQAYRERAKIGIDDVRAKRNLITSAPAVEPDPIPDTLSPTTSPPNIASD
jgi:hypothetical protein